MGFFAVEKEYRGQGIGYALLQKLESVLREKNIKDLWVSSVPETKIYYERQGFKLICEGEISGSQKFFMVKQLI